MSANSVYGFTGATIGKMPCLAISASTTAYGRNMIMTTREAVMAKFTIANGYEQDCDVIYGDTDSVMVNFKVREEGVTASLLSAQPSMHRQRNFRLNRLMCVVGGGCRTAVRLSSHLMAQSGQLSRYAVGCHCTMCTAKFVELAFSSSQALS